MNKQIKIVEVGPRDGLQNEKINIPTDTKIAFINQLSQTGLSQVEVSSFVSPKWVPQLADSHEVFQSIIRNPQVTYSALTPNLQGFNAAIASQADEVAIFTAASETFCQKNINCSIDESIERFKPLIELATSNNLRVRGYVSCVMGCPYEGKIPEKNVMHVTRKLLELGCYEVSLGDTIGVGTPLQARQLFQLIANECPMEKLAGHFHDTYGQALANIFSLLELGVQTFDSSVAGLGGCPYAKGATGNVATEDLIYLLDGMGIKTGINLDQLIAAGNFISNALQIKSRSNVASAKTSTC